MQLSIFSEDAQIPYSILEALWGEDPTDTLDELQKWELVELDSDKETVSLLDLHRDYLLCRGKVLALDHDHSMRANRVDQNLGACRVQLERDRGSK